MTDRAIHLIFDTSAIAAYGQHVVDVGETLAEVANEGGVVGVPLLCLAVAAAGTPEPMLDVLAKHPSIVVFADEPGDWQALAAALGLVDGLPAASAALAAIDWECRILTRTPESYRRIDSGNLLIAF